MAESESGGSGCCFTSFRIRLKRLTKSSLFPVFLGSFSRILKNDFKSVQGFILFVWIFFNRLDEEYRPFSDLFAPLQLRMKYRVWVFQRNVEICGADSFFSVTEASLLLPVSVPPPSSPPTFSFEK